MFFVIREFSVPMFMKAAEREKDRCSVFKLVLLDHTDVWAYERERGKEERERLID